MIRLRGDGSAGIAVEVLRGVWRSAREALRAEVYRYCRRRRRDARTAGARGRRLDCVVLVRVRREVTLAMLFSWAHPAKTWIGEKFGMRVYAEGRLRCCCPGSHGVWSAAEEVPWERLPDCAMVKCGHELPLQPLSGPTAAGGEILGRRASWTVGCARITAGAAGDSRPGGCGGGSWRRSTWSREAGSR